MTTQRDLYMAFMKGWRNGAGGHARNPDFTQHQEPAIRDAYDEGYKLGHANACEAAAYASLQYGYKPTILRAPEPVAFAHKK